jgi:hypothetical protein
MHAEETTGHVYPEVDIDLDPVHDDALILDMNDLCSCCNTSVRARVDVR